MILCKDMLLSPKAEVRKAKREVVFGIPHAVREQHQQCVFVYLIAFVLLLTRIAVENAADLPKGGVLRRDRYALLFTDGTMQVDARQRPVVVSD
jgi:hypothetical protein